MTPALEAASPYVVQQIPPPSSVLARCTLSRVDYADAFLVAERHIAESNHADRNAEQWARTMLEGASVKRRMALLTGWTALGLRLHSPWSREFILGWEVRRREPRLVLLGLRSRFGVAGELLFERTSEGLLFSTLVQLNNSAAHTVWSALAAEHCKVVRGLLRDATRA